MNRVARSRDRRTARDLALGTVKPDQVLEKVRCGGSPRLDKWENYLIRGDSLTVLDIMRRRHDLAGKIRLVYIDPPFATNQVYRHGTTRTATVSSSRGDSEAYVDRLKGSAYLTFLKQRLVLLREVLASDGSIYVHIDCRMGHYVKTLMDEVFGADRFINDITRIKCNPKNFERKAYGNIKDMVLFYSKTAKYVWNDPREALTQEDIVRLFPKTDSRGRRYATTPLHAPGETARGATGRPWNGVRPPRGRHWRYAPDVLQKLDELGIIEWSSTRNPRKKIYADEVVSKGKKRQDVWEFKDPPFPRYPTEKNLDMLKMIIEASSGHDDIVLDCFVGSGTTLVAAEETGRRWIGIDESDAAVATCEKRLTSVPGLSAFATYRLVEA